MFHKNLFRANKMWKAKARTYREIKNTFELWWEAQPSHTQIT